MDKKLGERYCFLKEERGGQGKNLNMTNCTFFLLLYLFLFSILFDFYILFSFLSTFSIICLLYRQKCECNVLLSTIFYSYLPFCLHICIFLLFSISFLFVGKGENSTCSTFIANSIGKSVNMTCSKGHDRTGHPYECPHQLHFKGWNYRCIFPYL